MKLSPSIDELWHEPETQPVKLFDPASLTALPPAVQRYLRHAIAPGTPLASSVRLRMHGEIKLKRWFPFTAEQVIHWTRGMIWQATVRMCGLPITGGDRLIDGQGSMIWKLLGLFPFINQAGPDITRSAAGRMNIESIWLPSVLCGPSVAWTESAPDHIQADFRVHDEPARVDYTLGPAGQLLSECMPRWGDPDHQHMRYLPFGAFIESEKSFEGYTIPASVRVGWHFGTDRFQAEGEFFRATIDHATFR